MAILLNKLLLLHVVACHDKICTYLNNFLPFGGTACRTFIIILCFSFLFFFFVLFILLLKSSNQLRTVQIFFRLPCIFRPRVEKAQKYYIAFYKITLKRSNLKLMQQICIISMYIVFYQHRNNFLKNITHKRTPVF